jgi:hypothetical protein
MSIIIYLFELATTNVFSKSKIFKFLKRDCGTTPACEIISGKIEIFSKHQRFLIATESSKYLLIIYIIYGDRTIIGFVGFVANLLNRPTDGATVSVRKSAPEKQLLFVGL